MARMTGRLGIALPIVWTLTAFALATSHLGYLSTVPRDMWAALGHAEPARPRAVLIAFCSHLAAMAALGALLSGAGVVGRSVGRWLTPRTTAASISSLPIVWGLGALSLLIQGLGLASILHVGLVAAIGTFVLAAGTARIMYSPRSFLPTIPSGAKVPAIVAAIALGISFTVARLPDTHEDARAYHMAAPESYLREHRIHTELRNMNWNMPRGAEMIFALGWALGDIEYRSLNGRLCCARPSGHGNEPYAHSDQQSDEVG